MASTSKPGLTSMGQLPDCGLMLSICNGCFGDSKYIAVGKLQSHRPPGVTAAHKFFNADSRNILQLVS